jgi:hypothetical protein
LARELICSSFVVVSLSHIQDLEPISQSGLELFHNDPVEGPTLSPAQLDTSGEAIPQLRQSLWNQALISQLAQRAQEIVKNSHIPERYGTPGQQIDWFKLFGDRIDRILREVHKCRHSNTQIATAASKKQLRSIRIWVRLIMCMCIAITTIHRNSIEDNPLQHQSSRSAERREI